MKLLHAMILLFTLSFPINARIHLYSRALAEKHVSDSIKAVDSLRVADSLKVAKHVADSMMTARYLIAGKEIVNENIRKQKEMEAYKPVAIDSSEQIIPDEVDNISARTIVIDENNQYAAQIDSLQNRSDSINNSIYDFDRWFKNMKTFPLSEKKRYMIYLMQNNLKDTAAILSCCDKLNQMYSSKIDLLIAIRNSQINNTKSFMTSHIENIKQHMTELSKFIVALSTDIPVLPPQQKRAELQ